ncbi:MAG: glutamate--tRNA ligase [Gammaproteobacteria bacterium]
MEHTPIKTRFAPSPTGYMHLGNARTALFNALVARKRGGVFLLRIEDTDAQRSAEIYRHALIEDLRWLGLDWQEGPEKDLHNGPYAQSQRGDIYRKHYDALIEQDRAYPCFCSTQELKQIRKSQLAAGQPPRYPGTCARLTAPEVEARLTGGMEPSLRFCVPKEGMIEFDDLVRGPQRYHGSAIGDFVIRRSDGTPAFFFCNAVDDALMGVTLVLRGEDHLSNTPRQLLLLNALGYEAPRYGHIALLTGPAGSPLSKRRGARSVRELREAGYLPLAINNYLARLGHVYERNDLLSPPELSEQFDLSRLGRASAQFDEGHLRYWQKEAVLRSADAEVWDWLKAGCNAAKTRIEALVPAEHHLNFVRAVHDNIELPLDAYRLACDLFDDTLHVTDEAEATIRQAEAHFFEIAAAQLPPSPDDFKAYARAVGEAAGIKGKALFMPLRAALTGALHGPEMARVFPLIGIERARTRLQTAQAKAKD